MRRCVLGLILPLFLGCAGKNTVAGQDKTKAEQLESSLPSWCQRTCTRLADCVSNTDCDCSGDVCDCTSVDDSCPSDCEKAFAGFTTNEGCAAVGQRYMGCIDHATCADLDSSRACLPTDDEQDQCPNRDDSETIDDVPPAAGGSVDDGGSSTGGTTGGGTGSNPGNSGTAGSTNIPAGPLVTCGSGSGGGMAGGGPATSGVICDESRQNCSDGHNYSWICSRNGQGETACSCLVDSSVTGAFSPGQTCPDTAAVNTGCHWNLSY